MNLFLEVSIFSVFIFLLVYLLFNLKWFVSWRLKVYDLVKNDDLSILEYENNIRTLLFQVLGGAAVIVGLFFTWQNLQLTIQRQQVELLNRTVSQLGSQQISVRTGALYELEDIANQSSEQDFQNIISILITFIREHSEYNGINLNSRYLQRSATISNIDFQKTESNGLSLDVFAATNVLKHLLNKDYKHNNYFHQDDFYKVLEFNSLDLQRCDLNNTNLEGSDFRSTHLRQSDLHGANLSNSIITNSNLSLARLDSIDFSHAQMLNSRFKNSSIKDSQFLGSNLQDVDFTNADLTNAQFNFESILDNTRLYNTNLNNTDFRSVDLSQVKGLTMKQVVHCRYNKLTKFPKSLNFYP